VVAHLTPGRVRKILKSARANPQTSWNIPALERLLENSPVPKDYSQYQSDPKKTNGNNDLDRTYDLITRYETGSGGETITFCREVTEAPLRVLKNKSKWGYRRVQYLVIDPAPLTPFGISRVRLASPNQNFMNIYLGNISSMLLLNSKPPLFRKGTFLKPTPVKRGAEWYTSDPNAEIGYKNMDNGSLAQYPSMAQQFMGQIQNIMGGQTMTINAGSKTSQFGKTAPGVQAGQDFAGLEANQITKILENFLRQYALVALDTLFSEQEGEDIIIVDDETKNAINSISPDYIGDDNSVSIRWEDLYGSIKEWSVEVDVSLSPDELKDQKRADLQDMLVVLAQNAQELGPDAVTKVGEITNMLLQDKVPLAKPMNTAPIQPTTLPPVPSAGPPQ
jgi:hypothetical protein